MVLNLKHFGHQLVSSRLKLLLESVCLSVCLSVSLSLPREMERSVKSQKRKEDWEDTQLFMYTAASSSLQDLSHVHITPETLVIPFLTYNIQSLPFVVCNTSSSASMAAFYLLSNFFPFLSLSLLLSETISLIDQIFKKHTKYLKPRLLLILCNKYH